MTMRKPTKHPLAAKNPQPRCPHPEAEPSRLRLRSEATTRRPHQPNPATATLRRTLAPVHPTALNARCTDSRARRVSANFGNRCGTESLQPRFCPPDVEASAWLAAPCPAEAAPHLSINL
ncbi:hypothetical protein [Lysobacter gummosus]|uniref:hypothetical protein n=1 Tax=Lysobacter gummosus TaxID=262324 RepID=UPI00363B39B6